MAARTFTSAGANNLWSNAANWDGGVAVPADGDSVTIPVGETCTYDYDMSAWVTGIDGLTITGTLNFETAAGTYHLMMKAATTINGAGTMNVGTVAVPIPFAAKHTITGGAGWYINGAGGLTMTVYAAEPTETYIKLSADEAAGQTVLSVDTDITGDIWADGDTIRINNIANGSDSEERTIAAGGIASGEITVTAGLTNAKIEGALVILMSRHVQFIGVDSGNLLQNFSAGNLEIAGGYFRGIAYIFSFCVGISISGGVFWADSGIGTSCSSVTIINGIFPYSTRGWVSTTSLTVYNGLFSGFGNLSGIAAVSSAVKFYGGIIAGNGHGLYKSDVYLNNISLYGNGDDIYQSVFIAYNTLLNSATQNSGYNISFNKEVYSESINYNQVQGAYKAWTKGGVTTLQSIVYPTGHDESYNIVLEDADNEGYFQKELVIGAGQSVNFDLYLRKDASMTYLPRFQIFLKRGTDPFAGGTPEHTFTMTNSVDIWENETYTYSNDGTEDETLVIRCLGKAASGNVYGMYDAEILNVDLTESLSRLAAIKAITDQFNFTVANQVDANALTGGASPVEIRTEMDANSTKLASILVDTGTTLPAVLDAIKGTGWTDEDLVAIKAAVDSVKTWTAANISASVTSGAITQIRGNTWDFEIPDLTLDSNLIQLAIKETKLDADAQALLLIDTTTGLIYVNGAAASDATKASLSYVGTTLKVTVDASITAQLPIGNHHYGIQSVTAAGVVSEPYGGTFTITADTVRATT